VLVLEAFAQIDEAERAAAVRGGGAVVRTARRAATRGSPSRARRRRDTARGRAHVDCCALGEALRAAGPPKPGRAAPKPSCALSIPPPVLEDRRVARALAHAYEHRLHRRRRTSPPALADGPAARAAARLAGDRIGVAAAVAPARRPRRAEAQLTAQLERGPATAEDWLELARCATRSCTRRRAEQAVAAR
jgi:hypothetical protein